MKDNKIKKMSAILMLILLAMILAPLMIVTLPTDFEKVNDNDFNSHVAYYTGAYPSEDILFDNINVSHNVYIANDSKVTIQNSVINEYTTFYLYDNAQLTLRNVTVSSTTYFWIHDNSILRLLDINGAIYTTYVYAYDNSNLFLENSTLDNLYLYSYAFSETYAYNTSFYKLSAQENATFTAKYITQYSYGTFYQNASMNVEDSKYYAELTFYRNSTGSMTNVTIYNFVPIVLYGNSKVTINRSSLDDIKVHDFAECDLVNSTFDRFYNYGEGQTQLNNVTGNYVYRGFIIENAIGNMTLDTVYMASGLFEYNVINDSTSTISFFVNQTYGTIKNSNFDILGSTVNYLHVYDSKIQSSKSTLNIMICDNSSMSDYYSLFGDITFRNTSVTLNGTLTNSIKDIILERSNMIAINNSYVYRLDCNQAQITLIDSQFAFLLAENSNVSLHDKTYTILSTKYLTLIDSVLYINNITMNNLVLDADPSDITIDASTIQNSNMYITNTTLTTNTSDFSGTYLNVYENSLVNDFNSTFYKIVMYGPSSKVTLENSISNYVGFTENMNILGEIKNATITTLVATAYGTTDRNKVIVKDSKIDTVYYSIVVMSGTVNLTNNVISSGSYNSSVDLFDSVVNNYHLTRLETFGGTVYVNDQVISIAVFNSTAVFLKNTTIKSTCTMINSQYDVTNSTFSTLELGWLNTDAISNGDIDIVPSNGTLYNITSSIIRVMGGDVWMVNITCSKLYDYGDSVYLENSTIGVLMQTVYFRNDGNITGGVPRGYDRLSVTLGPHNTINDSSSFYVVVYSGVVNITDNLKDMPMVIVYNQSVVNVENTNVEYSIICNHSEITFNSSSVMYIAVKDYGKCVSKNTTISSLLERDYAEVDLNNVTIDTDYFDYSIRMKDNSKLTIKNSEMDTYSTLIDMLIEDETELTIINTTISSDGNMYGVSANSSTTILFSNVSWSFYSTDCAFKLTNDANVTILNTTIDPIGIHSWVGELHNTSKLLLKSTRILAGESAALFLLFNLSRITIYNTTNFYGILVNQSEAYLYDSEVFGISAGDNAYFEVVNSYYIESSISYIIWISLRDTATGKIVNHSIPLSSQIRLDDSSELYLENVNTTDTSSISVDDYSILKTNNLTIYSIKTYFEINVTNMGYIDLVNSSVDMLKNDMSVYHYGSFDVNYKTYTTDATITVFNHTILQNTNISDKRYGFNAAEFVNGTVKNASFDQIIIKLLKDTAAPNITVSPKTTQFEKGMIVPDMVWTISEKYPKAYSIKKNGTLVQNGTYSSTDSFSMNTSNLNVGFWILTFSATDRAGHNTTITSNVTVYPSEAPVFTYTPTSPYNMTEGSTGNVLNWTATDRYPANYEIYVNGELKVIGSWSSGALITYNLDDLAQGNYTVRIVVYDQAGNSAENEVTVIVKAEIEEPVIGGFPLDYLLLAIGILLAIVLGIIIARKLKQKRE